MMNMITSTVKHWGKYQIVIVLIIPDLNYKIGCEHSQCFINATLHHIAAC